MGVPPKGNHFVDLQSSCGIASTPPCSQCTIFHLGQEVLGKWAANIVVITILMWQFKKPATRDVYVVIWTIPVVITALAIVRNSR